jgi:hypothetical protein
MLRIILDYLALLCALGCFLSLFAMLFGNIWGAGRTLRALMQLRKPTDTELKSVQRFRMIAFTSFLACFILLILCASLR